MLSPQASATPVFVKVPEPSVAATAISFDARDPARSRRRRCRSLSPKTRSSCSRRLGDVIATEGFVLSSLTVTGAALPMRPAGSVHDPLKTWPVVSVVWDWFGVQVTGPLIVSAPLVSMVTSSTNQPFEPGVPVAASVADGAVLSSLTVRATAVGGESCSCSCRTR